MGWRTGLELAIEKGPAPLMEEEFEVTGDMLRRRPEMEADGYRVSDRVSGPVLWAHYSRYMQRVAEQAPELVEGLGPVDQSGLGDVRTPIDLPSNGGGDTTSAAPRAGMEKLSSAPARRSATSASQQLR